MGWRDGIHQVSTFLASKMLILGNINSPFYYASERTYLMKFYYKDQTEKQFNNACHSGHKLRWKILNVSNGLLS